MNGLFQKVTIIIIQCIPMGELNYVFSDEDRGQIYFNFASDGDQIMHGQGHLGGAWSLQKTNEV